MRRAVFVFVVVALTGCGTIANVSGGRWRASRIYGGVLRDVESAEDWIADYSSIPKTELKQDVGVGVGVGLIAIDLPLSAIADTLTLPITIPATLNRPRTPDLPPPPVVNPVSAAKAPTPQPKATDPAPKPEEKSARDAKNADGSRK